MSTCFWPCLTKSLQQTHDKPKFPNYRNEVYLITCTCLAERSSAKRLENIFLRLYFLETFWGHCKIKRDLQRLSVCILLRTCVDSPIINILHQSNTFVTIDEPTLTHQNTQGLQFTLQVTLGLVYAMSLEKCLMTFTHHYNITEYIHCPKDSLCSTYSYPPAPRQPHSPITPWQPMILRTFL